jgi:phosphoglycerate dehydrogenase-like enzyme
VFTPHCAAQTDQAIDRMGHAAVAEVLRVVVHRTAPQHRIA